MLEQVRETGAVARLDPEADAVLDADGRSRHRRIAREDDLEAVRHRKIARLDVEPGSLGR
jgi:hypothetical protein